MPDPIKLAIEDVRFYIRNRTLRLPFRYGKACLTAAPLLHCRLRVKGENGVTGEGVSGDMLPPKWFDKSPEKTFRNNIDELIQAARIGEQSFRDAAANAETPFRIWQHADATARKQAADKGLNGLTAGFGVSILERAMIDAACRIADRPFHEIVRSNAIGLVPESVHADLAGFTLSECIPNAPLETIAVRHTVGFADPICDRELDDVPSDDTIPRSVEGWIREGKIRYFKIKVSGDVDADGNRLEALATLFDAQCPDGYHVTLDGNEQFPGLNELKQWYASMKTRSTLSNLLERVLYLEQPLERDIAIDCRVDDDTLPPLIIDESDDSVDAFQRAHPLGYRGCSVKNCKGVIPALLNAMIVQRLNRDQPGKYFLTSEDLCNQPIVPLQQDLCTLSTLGIAHSERNGHHYGGAADHLSRIETQACLTSHADLYSAHALAPAVRVEHGQLSIASIHQQGFGIAAPPDFNAMTLLEDWSFETLGVEDV
jgi:hypothetical protein